MAKVPRGVRVLAALCALGPIAASGQPAGERPESAPCGASVADGARPRVRVCPAPGPVEIDGVLGLDEWRGAARIDLSFEVYPADNAPAPLPTRCYLMLDPAHILVACDASDPDPSGIRAFFAPRDQSDGQDRIGLVFDPFNDSRRGFQFIVTPLGVQGDGVFEQQAGSVDDSWDAIWRSAGRITERGYTVELAIPFKSLRFPPGDAERVWGFYAWRARPRSENLETRSVPLDRANRCALCQAGRLTGLATNPPGSNVQLTPTLTAARTDSRLIASAGVAAGPAEVAAGADAQWSPSPGLSVAATVNPDFSQVEADVAQLDVNNRFALSYPEKRPFFVEGAELYNTLFRAVFTRTIVDPTFGSRLSGKLGRAAFGAIVAHDRVNRLLRPGNQGSSVSLTDASVVSTIARLRHDVGTASAVGALYAGREGAGYHNRVAGVDGFLQPIRSLTVSWQVLHSASAYPDSVAAGGDRQGAELGGDAGWLQLQYDSRTWRGQAFGRAVSPGFRADAGLVDQVDVREVNVWGQRQFWGQRGGWMERLNLTAGQWTKWRGDGGLTERVFWGNLLYLGPGLTRVFLDYQRRRELYRERYYSLDRYRAELSVRPIAGLGLSLEGRSGDAIDLANGRAATQTQLGGSLQLRLGRHADLEAAHAYQRLSRGGVRIVAAHLPQLKAVYNLSARAYARVIAQYQVTHRNPAAYLAPVVERETGLLSSLLLAYQVDPQTLLFVGYSEGRSGSIEPDGARLPFGLATRTFFVKASYARRP
ncbi:MAG: DUF5916 domain-containing protein [Gemmatimonadales bacterium]